MDEQGFVPANDFARFDAIELADLVRRKEVCATELVEAAIARIERLNPHINAVVATMYADARRIARGRLPDAPFAGVPFLLKDSLALYAGVPTTSASSVLRSRVAGHDSALVARLKRAGLIILGKTNCAEFGLLPTTEPRMFGATRNPWNPQRSPGGSSGGSAAAVAAGMVTMAHGTDGGGSIRIPASCCGVFGLKPTRARNPCGPHYGDIPGRLVVEHAITRSVRDSAALLDATARPELGDPYCVPAPPRSFLQEADVHPGRLRIAFSAPSVADLHPDCAAALQDAALVCRDLGHQVINAGPRIDYLRAAHLFTTLWAAGCAANLDGIAHCRGMRIASGEVEPVTWFLYETGSHISASEYQSAICELQDMARSVARFFSDFDVWLTPVVTEPPPLLGSFDAPSEDLFAAFRRAWAFAPIPAICNVTGQPAMSVPLYWNAEGLPIGSHFAGRFGDEATLFRLAAQLEQCRPWKARSARLI